MAGGVGGRRKGILSFAAGIGGTGDRADVGGTLSANPLSCAAGYYSFLKWNERMRRSLRKSGRPIDQGLNQMIEKYGLPFVAYNQGSIVHLETAGTMLLRLKKYFSLAPQSEFPQAYDGRNGRGLHGRRIGHAGRLADVYVDGGYGRSD